MRVEIEGSLLEGTLESAQVLSDGAGLRGWERKGAGGFHSC